MGTVGLLLSILGYFLVDRDKEVRDSLVSLREKNVEVRRELSDLSNSISRLELQERLLNEDSQDTEQRLRALERRGR